MTRLESDIVYSISDDELFRILLEHLGISDDKVSGPVEVVRVVNPETVEKEWTDFRFTLRGLDIYFGKPKICELSLALEKDAKQMSRDDLERFYISNGGY